LLFFSNIASAINIDNCSNLNQAGGQYYLTANIFNSSNKKCMNITADNVLLDCQGYTIDGIDTSQTPGVYANQSNTTVRNCVVTDWGYGIYYSGCFDNPAA
ncbi:unnamed protein product, partial [marine sediment metagenome]